MTLFNGDLTTPQQAANWIGNETDPALPVLTQFISSMSRSLLNKLNRTRLYSQTFTRTLDGVGNYQIILPDYPVTSIVSVQMGAALIPPNVLPPAPPNFGTVGLNRGYGYRFIPWKGELPGSPATLELVNGVWYYGAQNIRVVYNAGYLVSNEQHTVPATPFQVTVLQEQGMWCRDNGVSYADTAVVLTPVTSNPGVGEYIPPSDAIPGLYTFSTADSGASLLFTYSYVPSDLSEACNQMVAERLSYRERIGVISKSLGGMETMRWMRGGNKNGMFPDLPPEVEGLIMPYYNVNPPGDLGAPL